MLICRCVLCPCTPQPVCSPHPLLPQCGVRSRVCRLSCVQVLYSLCCPGALGIQAKGESLAELWLPWAIEASQGLGIILKIKPLHVTFGRSGRGETEDSSPPASSTEHMQDKEGGLSPVSATGLWGLLGAVRTRVWWGQASSSP